MNLKYLKIYEFIAKKSKVDKNFRRMGRCEITKKVSDTYGNPGNLKNWQYIFPWTRLKNFRD